MIGPIPVPSAGQRIAGRFTFAGDEGLAKYEWPFIAIAGHIAGPTVLVTAGIHAAEYTGIEAAIQLGRITPPESVRGTLVIIPLLNRPGFYERSIYVNPEDGDNLNRLFPGKPDGTWGERFAHRLLNEIVTKCDYLWTCMPVTSSRIWCRSSSTARPATLRSTSASSEWPTRTALAGP